MIPYNETILEQLGGDTPKEKYESLLKMQELLQKIAFPRRGSEEENWSVEDIARKSSYLIDIDKDYSIT